MIKSADRPDPRSTFRNKYLTVLIAAMALFSISAYGQGDAGKYSTISGYGFKYKRIASDSVFIIPLSTSTHIPYRSGGLRYNSTDSTLEYWTGFQWIKTNSALGIQTLQQVLNSGSVLTENETIVLHDSLAFASGKVLAENLRLTNLVQQTDTTTYKPVALDANGNLVKFNLWTTSANLQKITDNGPRTTNIILTKKQLYTPKIGSDSLAEQNFSFYFFPDLQGMTENFPPKLYSMFDLAVANKTTENIQAVITVGDLTDDATTVEFNRIDTAFDKLDAANIRYLAVGGNHDYNGGNISGGVRPSTSQWSAVFNDSRYTGKPWYPGYHYGSSTMNHYIKFDVGSYKFLILTMEFLPPDSVVSWAGRVVDSLPDYKVIISTHAYQTAWGERNTDTSAHSIDHYGLTSDNNGDDLWNKLIKKKENIVMVLNGHFITGTVENNYWVRRFSDKGDSGNVVHQIFMNYQQDSTGGSIGSNGQGWLMKMRFNPSTGDVFTSIYSPYLNQYDSRVDSFNIAIPSVAVKSDMGIKGSLQVVKEVRAGGGLFLGNDIAKYSVPFVGDQQKIIGTPNFTVKAGLLTVPNILINDLTASRWVFTSTGGRAVTNSNFAYDAANSRVGAGTTVPQLRMDVRTSFGVSTVSGANAYTTALTTSAPATGYVSHGDGNWGLNIQRFGTSIRGANISLFRSHSTDATAGTLKATPPGLSIGRISFQSVLGGSTSEVWNALDLVVFQDDTLSSNFASSLFIATQRGVGTDYETTPNFIKFKLFGDGALTLGNNPQRGIARFFVNGGIAANKDSVPLISSITTEDVLVIDTTGATGNQHKRIKIGNLPSSTTLDQAIANGNALTTNRTIANSTFQLDITGSRNFADGYTFGVTNTTGTTGIAIRGIATTGRGVWAEATSGQGVYGNATSGYGVFSSATTGNGLYAQSTSGVAIETVVNPSSTNTVVPSEQHLRTTSGTAANGIGQSLQFYTETASGINDSSAFVEVSYTDAAVATATSKLVFKLSNNALLAEKVTIAGSGQITEHGYGTGAFTGTPATRPVYTSAGVKVEEIHHKTYTALISQSGTSAPTVTILGTNTIGAIVWTRAAGGIYEGTLSGAFTANKTWCAKPGIDEGLGFTSVHMTRSSANTVYLNTGGDNFTNIPIEIRVYP